MSGGNTIAQSPRGSLGDGTSDYSPQTSPQSTYSTSGMNDLPATSVFYSSAGTLPLNVLPNAPPSIYSKSVISSVPSYQQQINRQQQQHHHHQQQPMQHQQQHQSAPAPQTPNSIPDIILTGASGSPISRGMICSFLPDPNSEEDFAKDLGSAMSSMSNFDASDLFSADAFKSDLPIEPIDFDGLQQILMTDSPSDENFRLERS